MNQIPIVDLYAQYLTIKKDIDKVITNVIKSSSYIGGPEVEKLEYAIAKYCGTKYAVALNSGTDGLYFALRVQGIGKGDEVITTPFSFFATAEVIVRVGAKPVFVDVDSKTYNINLDLIEEKITNKTKAIIPVHLFGLPTKMNEINKVAKKYKLIVIEDACQALGAKYQGRTVGSLSDIGCFSFFPSKNLGAWGDGGMVVTNNKTVIEQIRMLRNHGSKVKYFNELIGYNSRLDGIQAAILNVKLRHLNRWNKARAKVAGLYDSLLGQIDWIEIPKYDIASCRHVFHQYTIKIKNGKRDKVKAYLAKKGVASMVYYPIPLHLLSALKFLKNKAGSFPEAEKTCSEVLSLPIYPELSEKKVKLISKFIHSASSELS
jgi:hypothetical protein